MVDKINQLGGLGSEKNKSNKIQKKINLKKLRNKHLKEVTKGQNSINTNSDAQVEISQSAKEMLALRAEAERYLKHVQQEGGISSQEVEELKSRISKNYYLKEEIINKIVDKLLNLPGFSGKQE